MKLPKKLTKPPRVAAWLLEKLSPHNEGELTVGDLDEEFESHVLSELGPLRAQVWYWRQVLLSLPRALVRRCLASRPARTGSRERRLAFHLEDVTGELRLVLRSLSQRPTFTLATLGTLALGIGVNVAIYALVSGVVLRDLPFDSPERLVRVAPDQLMPFGKSDILAIEDGVTSFTEVAAWGRGLYLLTGGEEPEEVRGARVFANHFSMLGAEPLYGRWFLPDDGEIDAEPVVILSYGLWQRRFGADPDVVGELIELDRAKARVVGVMGPRHQAMEPDWQMWSVMTRHPDRDQGSGMALNARLREGTSLEAANEELRQVAERHWAEAGYEPTPDDLASLRLLPLRHWILGAVEQPLVLLLGAVGVVFLLACANVMSLLTVRSRDRDRELALRLALGASKARLARLLLLEAGTLAAAGGAVGIGLAAALVHLGRLALPAAMTRTQNVALDAQVLAFGLGLSVMATLLIGVAPALRATRRTVADRLRKGLFEGRRPLGGGYVLVALEVALAFVLLVAAGLMLRSFVELWTTDSGFDADRVVVARLSPPSARYDSDETRLAYYNRVLGAVRALSDVHTAGAIQFLPMTPGGWWSRFETPERPTPEGQSPPRTSVRVVAPGYFATLGIPLLAGRDFDEREATRSADAPLRIVVNGTLARAAWPDGDAVGKSLLVAGSEEPFEVIGVVGDVHQQDLATHTSPEVYVPLSRVVWSRMWIAARLEGSTRSAMPKIRTTIQSLDPQVVLSGVGTLRSVVGRTVAEPRFYTATLTSFAAVALLLGVVGLYGVVSYVASLERRRIGILLALGAAQSTVQRSLLHRGLLPVSVGILAGLLGAWALVGWLEGTLYGVSSRDPAVLILVPLLLLVTSVAAMWLPIRRAARLDPLEVLRAD